MCEDYSIPGEHLPVDVQLRKMLNVVANTSEELVACNIGSLERAELLARRENAYDRIIELFQPIIEENLEQGQLINQSYKHGREIIVEKSSSQTGKMYYNYILKIDNISIPTFGTSLEGCRKRAFQKLNTSK